MNIGGRPNFKEGYEYSVRNGIGSFTASSLNELPGVEHGFSARSGGVSSAPYDSLNLGWGRDEPRENIKENYKRFCKAFGIEYESMVLVNYEHGTNVVSVTLSDRERGFGKPPLEHCDAIITNQRNITLITSHADCMPVYLYDPNRNAIGLAHAGWKGTLGRIGQKMAEKMVNEFGCDTNDMFAVIGPCICVDCFEVDDALGIRFAEEFPSVELCYRTVPGKMQLDLELAAAAQLMDAGIPAERITLMHACTFELKDKLFSHRRDNGRTGAMAAFIKLN
ncbi:MAG: Laccase domain protein [Firmicutes bacterium ADurb.Bin182]|nr:MAG: Laccase domain protein [Firmicutes bacterium ADurb.Bin182]